MAVREIAGRRFTTEEDYQAGLRDQKKIEEIRKQYNLNNPAQVFELYRQMEAGLIHFETILGTDFDDEVYEKIENLKKKGIAENSNKIKGAVGKSTKKRINNSTNNSINNRTNATYGRKNGNGKHQELGVAQKKDAHISVSEEEIKAAAMHKMHRNAIIRRVISLIAAGVAVLCLGYFFIYSKNLQELDKSTDMLTVLKHKNPVAEPVVHLTEEDDEPLEILDEYKNLYIKNKSIIGWLKIDDTNIDYPVMQTSNNEYFLNHNFEGEEDKNGSLFLDKDCDVIHRSTNLIVYGHHMKSGKMFGSLNKYSDISYYEKHPFIQFDTIYEKGVYQVMYVFRDKVRNEDTITFKYYQFIDANSADEFNSNMQEMAKMSLYHTGVEATYSDQLLTLSTCDHTEEDGRFVVVAKRVE